MRLGVLFVVFCAFAVAGCDNLLDINDPSPNVQTEFFEDTLQPGERKWHGFTIIQAGQLTATILSAGSAVTINLGVGVPEGPNCDPLALTTFPVSTPPQIAGPATPGPLCVIIEDDGTLTEPISYRIQVEHT